MIFFKKNLSNKGTVYNSICRQTSKEKSIEVLIEEQKIWLRNMRIKLAIVGDGPDMGHYQDLNLKRWVQKKMQVLQVSIVDRGYKYYQLCIIFVTAQCPETQGLTVIEAMAALPVVAVNDAALVVDGLNGYLFETKEYGEYVESFINDPIKLKKFSKQVLE